MTDWTKVGQRLADIAPMLGTVVGGPAGTAIGSVIAATLGTANNPDAVLAEIRNNPEAALKLKELEYAERDSIRAQALAMAQNEVQLAGLEMADQQQARATHKDHWMPSLLTIALSIMVSTMTYMIFTVAVPESSKEVAFFIVGQVMTAFITAITFWLGSSRGSHDKSRELREKML